MRCYLVGEPIANLAGLRDALSRLDVTVVEAGAAFDSAPSTGSGWIPTVDFLCAVFSSETGWETPVSIYLEIGQALGAGLPVLVIAEPPRKLDPALSPLRVVRVPISNQVALTSHVRRFLDSIGRGETTEAPPSNVERQRLASVRHDLADFRRELRTLDATSQVGHRLEQIAVRLFEAAGAELQPARQHNDSADFAVWIPGTEKFLSGPLLVEVKLLRTPRVEYRTLRQLQELALRRGSPLSLLLYFKVARDRPVQWPDHAARAGVIALDIEDLTQRLEEQNLAQIVKNERNALIHGVGPK